MLGLVYETQREELLQKYKEAGKKPEGSHPFAVHGQQANSMSFFASSGLRRCVGCGYVAGKEKCRGSSAKQPLPLVPLELMMSMYLYNKARCRTCKVSIHPVTGEELLKVGRMRLEFFWDWTHIQQVLSSASSRQDSSRSAFVPMNVPLCAFMLMASSTPQILAAQWPVPHYPVWKPVIHDATSKHFISGTKAQPDVQRSQQLRQQVRCNCSLTHDQRGRRRL